jgi:uncharacterized membrane protein HdeD (DUF308 family)
MAVNAPASPTALETKQRPWWLTLIAGVMAMVVGAVMLWGSLGDKVDLYLLLVQLLGVYWLVVGIMDLVHMFVDHSAWAWKLIMGIISIIAGGYILMYPVASALALPRIFVLVLGIWALIQGCLMLLLAFKGGGWGAGVLGVLGIILGLVLMSNYSSIGWGLSMIWTAALFSLIGGAVMIWRAFQHRSLAAAS